VHQLPVLKRIVYEFKHEPSPIIEYDNESSSYGMPADETILAAIKAGKFQDGTMKDQASLTARILRDWFPSCTNPTEQAIRTATKAGTFWGGTKGDRESFTAELLGNWFPSMNPIGQPRRPKI
jgi:hypothetical protein